MISRPPCVSVAVSSLKKDVNILSFRGLFWLSRAHLSATLRLETTSGARAGTTQDARIAVFFTITGGDTFRESISWAIVIFNRALSCHRVSWHAFLQSSRTYYASASECSVQRSNQEAESGTRLQDAGQRYVSGVWNYLLHGMLPISTGVWRNCRE